MTTFGATVVSKRTGKRGFDRRNYPLSAIDLVPCPHSRQKMAERYELILVRCRRCTPRTRSTPQRSDSAANPKVLM